MQLKFSINDIDEAAQEFIRILDNNKVIAFHGEMGAGKTTFISAVAKGMGSSEKVSSPTFSIINEYALKDGILYHMDLYRVKDEQEAIDAGVEECICSGHLCLIEWPERAPGLLPPGTLHCSMVIAENGLRKLSLNL